MGIAGVNTRPLARASLGIAGNMSSTIRPTLVKTLDLTGIPGGNSLGDRAARTWDRACYLSDASYIACQAATGGIRWRGWSMALFGRQQRKRPLGLDSGCFRRRQGKTPRWFTYEAYLRAIDVTEPDFWMAYDVWGDQQATLANYERMIAEGYGDERCIPVWQMSWDDRASTILERRGDVPQTVRTAIANARLAVRDPVFRWMASHSRWLAVGGMVKGPCPREVRGVYLGEVARLCPELMLWGLGQACPQVINSLGTQGLLGRVSLDSSHWILNAANECIPVLEDGLLKSVRLTSTGAESFFTLLERMAAHLRAFHAAYTGAWTWPGPPAVPTDMRDLDARLELQSRLAAEQMTLLDLFPQERSGDPNEEASD